MSGKDEFKETDTPPYSPPSPDDEKIYFLDSVAELFEKKTPSNSDYTEATTRKVLKHDFVKSFHMDLKIILEKAGPNCLETQELSDEHYGILTKVLDRISPTKLKDDSCPASPVPKSSHCNEDYFEEVKWTFLNFGKLCVREYYFMKSRPQIEQTIDILEHLVAGINLQKPNK
mmetsp:Transcript_30134/g.59000  ORF Transcript_30134/g.59000 Transcript_30134/m.59000 type:complete len:173 (+) Transcript_30134:52-570(+)|eukprot:CAMPEP_0175138844 /NCGR_PEP_ID=MMETSP0087-20121206/10571_1 /TAXON_ID=136419 /ORGANISM="Unknown Unknown, Strain D1" /LENGTH=172 /DNA_ID=CAMNT_0016421785 /DNA_START=51 /DNA_END=569 /DNA_ORIENTATION=-